MLRLSTVSLVLFGVVSCFAACSSSSSDQPVAGTDAGGAADAGGDAAPIGPSSPAACVSTFTNGAPALDSQGCPAKPATPDAIDEALTLNKLDRCSLSYDPSWRADYDSTVDDAFRLPFQDTIHDHPFLLPPFARNLATDIDAANASSRPVSQAIAVAAARIGKAITACDPGSDAYPAGNDAAPLAHAVGDLIRAHGQDADDASLADQTKTIPLDFQQALVPIVRVLSEANDVKTAFLGSYADEEAQFARVNSLAIQAPSMSLGARVQEGLAKMDFSVMATYGARVASAIESANLARFANTKGFSLSVATPMGAIVIGDGEAHTYAPTDPNLDGNVLLLVDTGGDDTYRIPVGANQTGAVASVAIDLAGNDTYGYVEVPNTLDGTRLPSDMANGRYQPTDTPDKDDGPVSLSMTPRQGAGFLGVGMLFDLGAGNDHYKSLRLSQGYGGLGVGVLFDEAGNDDYAAEAMSQGAGLLGIGLQIDRAGNDVRHAYHMAQGFSSVRAFGGLFDLDGDDQYLADIGDPAQGGDPLYFTPQLPGKGNDSFVQGSAFGYRDDTNSVWFSGGIGVLRDSAGADTYRAGVTAQGSAFWFATGLLLDKAGDDQYDALWYTQGTAAHFAHGLFLDEAGNDKYGQNFPPIATGPAVGHDYSLGFMIDLGGDDLVRGSVLGLGSGIDNGTGVLINLGGNDHYFGDADANSTWQTHCFGYTQETPNLNRTNSKVFGLFVDVGGTDVYQVNAQAGPVTEPRDGTSWVGASSMTAGTTHLGSGIDKNTGSVSLP